jgi:S1-C subfamily serine protease
VDDVSDVALLRLTDPRPANLPVAPLGRSDDLVIGEWAIAIGNPFGYLLSNAEPTVTAGVISGVGRNIIPSGGERGGYYLDMIQTDASINPGNSGGALVNIKGQLLGVNTAILSGTGGNIGIGFAIPSNMVSEVVAQLLEHGNVQRGRIGLAIQDVTPGLAEALDLKVDRGALVTQTDPGSPSERAGIAAGDVIVAVDGEAIDSSADLRNEVGLVRAGEAVEVTFVRDGQRHTVRATVAAESPNNLPAARAADPASVSRLAGATVMELPSDHPAYGRVRGIWVSAVAAGSAAALFGLRPDDLITGVNREPVASVADLSAALADARPPVALQVQREGRALFLLVR